MRLLREWLHRLWGSVVRRRSDFDLRQELQSHLELAAERSARAGGATADDVRAARLRAGGIAQAMEALRDQRGVGWIEGARQDVRYAVRGLRRSPAFTLTTLLTLTLGIGANTAIFSLVNAVLLRPLPVREPDRLLLFTDDVSQGTVTSDSVRGGRWDLFSSEVYAFLQSQPSPFTSIAAFESGDYTGSLAIPGQTSGADVVKVDFVSGNYFETLGAVPVLGRALIPSDDRLEAPATAVASERFWRERLGSDPNVMGRSIIIDGDVRTVVGVMPQSFFGVRVQQAPDVWVPLSRRGGRFHERPELHWLSLIGRLDDGGTLDGAQAAVTMRLRQFLTAHAAAPIDEETRQRIESAHVVMADGSRGISMARAQNSQLLILLLAAVTVILLIACANVGTLLLARAAVRERDVAVRRALGASRGRLIRQWLTETVLLGTAGAVCGTIAATVVAPRLLARFVSSTVPMAATTDRAVLAFTIAVTAVACLLFGLAPSLNAGRVDPVESLRLSGRSQRRRRTFGLAEPFVVVQIAMSLVLVVAATLLVRTLLNLQQTPFGFDQERVLLVRIDPRAARYTPATVVELYRRIHDRLRALPGVEAVTFARYAPFGGLQSSGRATIEGQESGAQVESVLVGPNYPQTIGMMLIAGRALGFDDSRTAGRVAMVNETFANRYFRAAAGAIGRHFDWSSWSDRPFEIVGVLKDAHFRDPRAPVGPTVFVPILQDESGRILDGEVEVRTAAAADAMAPAIRDAIASVDSRVTVRRMRTLRAQVLATFGPERTAAGFIGTFAALALIVASIGLYGLVSHGLATRTGEIGIRIALGATRLGLVRMVARESLLRLAAGLSLGGVFAYMGRRLLANQLFGITPDDAGSALLSMAVLTAVVALATLRPTLRALRVDPVTALRAE